MNQMVTTFAPTSLAEAKEFAKELASSGLVPNDFRNKPTDILVAIQWGYELNLQPLQALQNISVINGKPSVWGDTLLSLVASHPNFAGCDEAVENNVATCTIRRQTKAGIQETTRTFSKEDAQVANLWSKRGPWQSYPKRMLQMRARGFALRDAFPDALKGVISREEAIDMPVGEIKDITPKTEVEQSDVVTDIRKSFPDAEVKRVAAHGTFQSEMMEKWQSITTKQLVEYRQTKTNEEVRNILTRWREEAMACFNLCQTREQYLTVETRLIDELKEIESAGQGKWVEAFHKNLGGKIAEISDRIDAAQTNQNPQTAAVL